MKSFTTLGISFTFVNLYVTFRKLVIGRREMNHLKTRERSVFIVL